MTVCDIFDISWRYLIAAALLLSMIFVPVRMKIAELAAGQARKSRNAAQLLARLQILSLWAWGLVAIITMTLFILGIACAGSLGDIAGIVPD
jgi:hypothetical protein